MIKVMIKVELCSLKFLVNELVVLKVIAQFVPNRWPNK